MRVTLPLTFNLDIDEAAIQDLQIDFGAAVKRHARGVDWSHGFPTISEEGLAAFRTRLRAREKLWKMLIQSIKLPPEAPARLESLVALSALCQLFQIEAHVATARLLPIQEDAHWDVEIHLTDRAGNLLANAMTISSAPFPPDDHYKSHSAFFGAVVEGVRECARNYFVVGEAYDDQDVR